MRIKEDGVQNVAQMFVQDVYFYNFLLFSCSKQEMTLPLKWYSVIRKSKL